MGVLAGAVARLPVASHGGCGGQDVDVVTQPGDLPVADGEHNDVGQRELAGGCAGPDGFLLDDDRFRIAGVVDGTSAVPLILQLAGLPARGYPVHDGVPALEPGRHARGGERELMDRVDCVQTAHVSRGLADSGLAKALQNLTRTSFLLAECRSPGRHLAAPSRSPASVRWPWRLIRSVMSIRSCSDSATWAALHVLGCVMPVK